MSFKRSTQRRHRALVDDAVAYIAEHLDQALDLGTLASRAGLSPHHFQRVFRGQLGESPKQYVRRLRLERSRFLLSRPGASVTDVAFESAYATHESFTRAFHKRFGVAPRTFQRQADGRRRETTTPFEVVQLPATRMATVPFAGSYNDQTAFDTLAAWAAPIGLLEQQNIIGIYFDDQTVTPEDQTRGEAAVPVPESTVLPSDSGVRERIVPAGHYAFVHHRGNYSVRDTYEEVFRHWFPTSGWRPSGRPTLVEYHRDSAPFEASLLVGIERSRD